MGKSSSSPEDRKQFRPLHGEPLIFLTLRPFLDSDLIQSVVLVVPGDAVIWTQDRVKKRGWPKRVQVVSGGRRRQDSVRSGLKAVPESCDVVIIHDAVRPFVRPSWIEETARLCEDYDGAIVAVEASDTLKRVEEGVILETVKRRGVWQAQTPQAFRKTSLVSAFKRGDSGRWKVTDEAQLVERSGGRVAVVRGSSLNIKITSPGDWKLAVFLQKGMSGD